jgi:hypothetical protein
MKERVAIQHASNSSHNTDNFWLYIYFFLFCQSSGQTGQQLHQKHLEIL